MTELPAGICDCHMHAYGRPDKYPVAPTNVLAVPDAPVSAYRAVMAELGIARAVVVQPSAYGIDNRCTVDAVAELGAAARGIAMIGRDTSPGELATLNDGGIRGIRLHLLIGKLHTWSDVPAMAEMVQHLGWHIELQMDGRDLAEREALLAALPGRVVIDHIGKFREPVAADHPSFRALLRLVERGNFWVKISGAYETSKSGPPDYADVAPLASALVAAAPERMVWASNWPHPSAHGAKPDDGALMRTLVSWMGDAETRRRILVDNPATLYGF